MRSKGLEGILEQTTQTHTNNKPEVYRMEVNFKVFDEKVKELIPQKSAAMCHVSIWSPQFVVAAIAGVC